MQKLILPILSLFLLFPAAASANSASVSVNNVVNSNSSTTINSTANSHVRVETNGNVQEYNGNGSNIHVESINGTSKITVNGQTIQSPSVPPQPTTPPVPTPRPTVSPTVIKQFNDTIASTQAQMITIAQNATQSADIQPMIEQELSLLEFLKQEVKTFISLFTT
jgi:hypothetical protein